ncbi:MAG TPA: hypothetical protein VFQ61_08090 [Polyangiaceae bacterium]|nr:hypothetical protein [Polyangiaceae bacterium]
MSSDAKMSSELSGQEPVPEEPSKEASRPLSRAELDAQQAGDLLEPSNKAEEVMLGARHDFSVKDSSGAIPCKCVGAMLGPPSSGKLQWRGDMPRTKPETQLVLALVPDDSPSCGVTTAGAGGASYWGYRMEGDDVVVLLENWNSARPRTLGAIIPKPVEGAQVYLAPVNPRFPYGTSTSDSGGRCALGNPGPKRSRSSGVEAGASPFPASSANRPVPTEDESSQ